MEIDSNRREEFLQLFTLPKVELPKPTREEFFKFYAIVYNNNPKHGFFFAMKLAPISEYAKVWCTLHWTELCKQHNVRDIIWDSMQRGEVSDIFYVPEKFIV